MIFAAARNTEMAKEGYQAVKSEAARLGRDPDHISICNILMPVTGATKAEAEDKMALISKLPLEIDALSLLAEALNFDFASKGIDEPFTTEELAGMTGMLGIRDGVLKRSGKKNPSARDFISFSGRGYVDSAVVGGPKEIADYMEEMFSAQRLRRLRDGGHARARAPTAISCATSSRSCSGAASTTRTTPARRCARTLGSRVPASAHGRCGPRKRRSSRAVPHGSAYSQGISTAFPRLGT